MTDAKKEKQKQHLMKANLMEQNDTIVDFFQANFYRKLVGNMGQWAQTWLYFTEQRLICTTGILEENIVIPYTNIRQIRKCNQWFVPMGIAITYENPNTGKTVTDKFSVMKRQKWIDFLTQKSGVSLS